MAKILSKERQTYSTSSYSNDVSDNPDKSCCLLKYDKVLLSVQQKSTWPESARISPDQAGSVRIGKDRSGIGKD